MNLYVNDFMNDIQDDEDDMPIGDDAKMEEILKCLR